MEELQQDNHKLRTRKDRMEDKRMELWLDDALRKTTAHSETEQVHESQENTMHLRSDA
jgi:hypothetical protein